MATMTAAALATSAALFLFVRRNLASSNSSFSSLRSVFLPAHVYPLVARSVSTAWPGSNQRSLLLRFTIFQSNQRLCRRLGGARPPPLSATGFCAVPAKRHDCVVAAASAAGSPQFSAGENDNPYEILGISPLDGFDKVNMAYKRRRKDAESSGDGEYLVKLDRAYDKVMMEQLQNRKKGVAYWSIQVSKDIKYADHQPIVPWGPRSCVYLQWATQTGNPCSFCVLLISTKYLRH